MWADPKMAPMITRTLAGFGVMACPLRHGFFILCIACAAWEAHAAVPAVCSGIFHACALKADGTVTTWGWDGEGQLGTRPITSASVSRVQALPSSRAIGFGSRYATALTREGRLWVWGDNVNGELGDGTRSATTVPWDGNRLANVIAIAPSPDHQLALTADGMVWAWGQCSRPAGIPGRRPRGACACKG